MRSRCTHILPLPPWKVERWFSRDIPLELLILGHVKRPAKSVNQRRKDDRMILMMVIAIIPQGGVVDS